MRIRELRQGFCLLVMVVIITIQTVAADSDDLAKTANEETGAQSREIERVLKSLLLDIVQTEDRLIVVGERGHIALSDDRGDSWRLVETPTQAMLTAVFFVDQHGWAVGHDGTILYSGDRGETWALQHERKMSRLEDKALAVMWSDDIDRLGMPLLDVWFADENTGFAVGAYGWYLQTTDGGKQWQELSASLDNFEGFHLNAVSGLAAQQAVFIVGEAGMVLRSRDLGNSWEFVNTPYEGSLFGVELGLGAEQLLVYGLGGALFQGAIFGDRWSSLPLTADNNSITDSISQSMPLPDGRLMLLGTGGLISTLDASLKVESTDYLIHRQGIMAGLPLDNHLLLVGQFGLEKRAQQ